MIYQQIYYSKPIRPTSFHELRRSLADHFLEMMVEILGRSEAESHRKSVHRDVRSCHDYPLRLFDPRAGSPDTEVLHHHILEVPAEEPGIHTATLDDVVSVTFVVQ